MPRRLPLLLLAVLLLGAAALFVWRRDPPPSSPPPAVSTAPGSSARPIATAIGPAAKLAAPLSPLRLAPARVERDAALATGAFEGRVVSWANGRGVAGAQLTFLHGDATVSVNAAQDGAFRWTPPAAEVYSLVLVTAPGHVPFAPEWGHSPITLRARPGVRVRDVIVYLSPEVEYAILVRDAQKQPVGGAEVRVTGAGRGGSARADAAGQVRLVAPDGALIEARAPGFSTGRARVDFAAQVSRRVVIELAGRDAGAEATASIAGRVLDPKGEPLDGALITAHAARGASLPVRPEPGPRAVALSDDDGRFAVDDLEAGAFDLSASHPGLTPAEAPAVASGTQDVILRLSDGSSIRGAVREASTGAPVPAFTVLVWRRVGPLERQLAARAAVLDAEGAYEVSGLAPGPHAVSVVAHGFAPAADVAVEVPRPPADPVRADFDLGRGGRVSGLVVEEEGRAPIEGARVSLEGRAGDEDSAVPVLAATTTDASGRFELRGLAAGLRSLTVAASGHHGRIVSGLVVGGEGDVGPITVELARTKDGEEPRLELTGIGAVLSAKDDALVIGQVIDGGGAKEAGLGPGDAIVRIDGVPVVQVGFEGAIQRIRGPEGSRVVLSVRRGGAGEPTDVVVVRRRIRG